MKRKFKDFKVKKITNSERGDLFAVYMAKTILFATYHDEETAKDVCDRMNNDPWHFDRQFWKEYKDARISYTSVQAEGY